MSANPLPFETPSPLAAARGGDEAAFTALVRAHESMVYSLALHFFHDARIAEEVAQDVFLQLYRGLDSIESDAHLVAWLRRVTSNRCIDSARRNRLHCVPLDETDVPSAG